MNTVMTRRALAALAAAMLLTVAGCAGSVRSAGPPMMDGGAGYRYSRLSCSAGDLPGQVVTVMLADMGMTRMMTGTAPVGAHMMLRAVPAAVTSGQVSFVAENMGWRTHELVVLPLAPGAVAGQRVSGPDGKVDEAGSLGEASADCAAGASDGIPAGAVSWVTLTLPPGTYEIVCNLTNHYADGMYQQFTVTAAR